MQIIELPIEKLVPDPNNARKHDSKNLDAIRGSLAKFGQQTPIVIDAQNIVLKGNGTVEAAKQLGWTSIKTVRSQLTTNTDKVAYALADNRSGELASWDMDVLGSELVALRDDNFDIGEIGFDEDDLSEMDLFKDEPTHGSTGDSISLSERFLCPPFSVLDTKQGYWQDRKRVWLSFGIKSELGRGGQKHSVPVKSGNNKGMCDQVCPR